MRFPLAVPFVRSLALLLLVLPRSPAQSMRGDDVVVADYGNATVWRVQPGGTVTALFAGPPLVGPTAVAIDAQRHALIVDFRAASLFELSNAGNLTPVATGLSGPLRVAMDHNGDALVTELSLPGLSRITPGGTRTVIHQGPPFQRPFGIAVDGDGSYLVADDGAVALFRVTPGGSVTPVHSGLPFRLPQGVSVLGNGDYAVMDGIADAVFVVPRGGGVVTTLVATPTLGNPCGITADFQGGVLVSESGGTLGNRVVQIDATGQLTVVAQGSPFNNIESLGHVPTLVGPVRGQAGQGHVLDLDLPAQANRPYILFLCGSLYPGFGLGGIDPRHSPCNPDGLFFASIGANSPLFAGFAGLLSPAGMATASLNVPAISLPPLTLFAQGFAVSFQSPHGVAALTSVHALPF